MASFTVQSHLTYALPVVMVAGIGVGFFVASRPGMPRRWLVATLAVLAVCWSLPLVEEAIHRPGNVERIVQAATAGERKYGASAGFHSVVRAVGVPPWWLREPRAPFTRIAEVIEAPSALSTASAALVLVLLLALGVAGLRSRRREIAVAAFLALGLMIALFGVTATTPGGAPLFPVISYTIWWASPAGMFAWLVLAFGLFDLLRGRVPSRARRLTVPATAAGVVSVAVAGALVAAGEKHDRLENAFDPAATIVERVRAGVVRSGTVFITGDRDEIAVDLQGAIAYGLRSRGLPFVVSSLPGIGTRYDPARHPHDMVLAVTAQRPAAGARVIARAVLVNVPSDAPRARRAVFVTLSSG